MSKKKAQEVISSNLSQFNDEKAISSKDPFDKVQTGSESQSKTSTLDQKRSKSVLTKQKLSSNQKLAPTKLSSQEFSKSKKLTKVQDQELVNSILQKNRMALRNSKLMQSGQTNSSSIPLKESRNEVANFCNDSIMSDYQNNDKNIRNFIKNNKVQKSSNAEKRYFQSDALFKQRTNSNSRSNSKSQATKSPQVVGRITDSMVTKEFKDVDGPSEVRKSRSRLMKHKKEKKGGENSKEKKKTNKADNQFKIRCNTVLEENDNSSVKTFNRMIQRPLSHLGSNHNFVTNNYMAVNTASGSEVGDLINLRHHMVKKRNMSGHHRTSYNGTRNAIIQGKLLNDDRSQQSLQSFQKTIRFRNRAQSSTGFRQTQVLHNFTPLMNQSTLNKGSLKNLSETSREKLDLTKKIYNQRQSRPEFDQIKKEMKDMQYFQTNNPISNITIQELKKARQRKKKRSRSKKAIKGLYNQFPRNVQDFILNEYNQSLQNQYTQQNQQQDDQNDFQTAQMLQEYELKKEFNKEKQNEEQSRNNHQQQQSTFQSQGQKSDMYFNNNNGSQQMNNSNYQGPVVQQNLIRGVTINVGCNIQSMSSSMNQSKHSQNQESIDNDGEQQKNNNNQGSTQNINDAIMEDILSYKNPRQSRSHVNGSIDKKIPSKQTSIRQSDISIDQLLEDFSINESLNQKEAQILQMAMKIQKKRKQQHQKIEEVKANINQETHQKQTRNIISKSDTYNLLNLQNKKLSRVTPQETTLKKKLISYKASEKQTPKDESPQPVIKTERERENKESPAKFIEKVQSEKLTVEFEEPLKIVQTSIDQFEMSLKDDDASNLEQIKTPVSEPAKIVVEPLISAGTQQLEVQEVAKQALQIVSPVSAPPPQVVQMSVAVENIQRTHDIQILPKPKRNYIKYPLVAEFEVAELDIPADYEQVKLTQDYQVMKVESFTEENKQMFNPINQNQFIGSPQFIQQENSIERELMQQIFEDQQLQDQQFQYDEGGFIDPDSAIQFQDQENQMDLQIQEMDIDMIIENKLDENIQYLGDYLSKSKSELSFQKTEERLVMTNSYSEHVQASIERMGTSFRQVEYDDNYRVSENFEPKLSLPSKQNISHSPMGASEYATTPEESYRVPLKTTQQSMISSKAQKVIDISSLIDQFQSKNQQPQKFEEDPENLNFKKFNDYNQDLQSLQNKEYVKYENEHIPEFVDIHHIFKSNIHQIEVYNRCIVENFFTNIEIAQEKTLKNRFSHHFAQFFENSKLLTKALKKCLKDCHVDDPASIKKLKRRIRCKNCHTVKELCDNKRLIEIYDINFKDIIYPNVEQKLIDNQSFMNLHKDELVNVENMVDIQLFRINFHIQRTLLMQPLLFTDKLIFQKTEKQLIDNFKSDQPKYYDDFNQQLKGQRFVMDPKQFENYFNYVDLAWQNKNKKLNILTIIDQCTLNSLDQSMTLFDIKTKIYQISQYYLIDCYSCLNWDAIHYCQEKLDDKKQKFWFDMDDYKKKLHQINLIVANVYNQMDILYAECKEDKEYIYEKLVSIPEESMANLAFKYESQLNVMQITLKLKVGLLVDQVMFFVNECIFTHRFNYMIAIMDFRSRFNEKLEKQKISEDNIRKQKLCSNFNEHLACNYISKNDKFQFLELFFKLNKIELIQKLYDSTQDYLLYAIIEKLYQVSKKVFLSTYLSKDLNKINYFNGLKEDLDQDDIKFSTLQILGSNKPKIFQRDVNEIRQYLHPMRTDRRETPFVTQYREYKRQGAMNKYNKQYCEGMLIEQLQKNTHIVSDKSHIFYKRIETLIDRNDQDYNSISHKFGYKSQVVRESKETKYMMEIFMPILIKNGQLKLLKHGYKINQMMSIIGKNKLHNINKDMIYRNVQSPWQKGVKKENKEQKILKDLVVEDFHTDDSLKSLNFDDIKSFDSESQDEDFQDAPKGHHHRCNKKGAKEKLQKQNKNIQALRNLKNFETPAEYYNNMRINRENAEKEAQKKLLYDANDDNLMKNITKFSSTIETHQNFPDFVVNLKKKCFKVQTQEEFEEDDDEGKNILKIMKNKLRVESLLEETQNNVLRDNIDQIKNMEKQYVACGKIRQNAIEMFESQEAYETSVHGKALEQYLSLTENAARKMIVSFTTFQLSNEMEQAMISQNIDSSLAQNVYNPNPTYGSETENNDQDHLIEIKRIKTLKDPTEIIGSHLLLSTQTLQNKISINNLMQQKLQEILVYQQEEKKKYQIYKKKQFQEDEDIEEKDDDEQFLISNEILILQNLKKKNLFDQKVKQKRVHQKHLIQNLLNKQSTIKNKLLKNMTHLYNEAAAGIDSSKNVKKKRIINKVKKRLHQPTEPAKFSYNQPWGKHQEKALLTNDCHGTVTGESILLSSQKELSLSSLIEESFGEETLDPSDPKQIKNMFISKMFQAVKDMNIGLMEDILARYQGSTDNVVDDDGNSLITLAVIKGHDQMVKLLLDKGMDPNTQNHNGDSPLHYAISGNFRRCIDILITSNQVDEKLQNKDGLGPWEMK